MSVKPLTTSDMDRRYAIMQWLSKYSFIIIFFLLLIVSSSLSNAFLTPKNLFNILLETSVLGVVSVGTTFVILIAGIDLSIGGVIALSGMVSGVLSKATHGSVIIAIAAALLTGCVVGLVNGVATVYGRVPSFVVTLATGTIASGLALLITGGQPIYNLSKSVLSVGGDYIGPIPLIAIIWLVIALFALLVLKLTPFGRQIYAIGDNNFAAFLSGIRVNLYTILIFVVAGLLSGLGGFLYEPGFRRLGD
ncbi:ABC transporter permease [Alicyclobacillus suci]|uniref:ABC transporter permease n=1 Tax=Alicyclobacillus suci TaxID=2816080 RepID=UPI001A8F493A|nr:ABC transporter permease [Alicyclobacillus suci]